jgi:hypothetical protein
MKGKVERSAKLYKRAPKCQSLKICLVWKIVRNPLPVVDKEQAPLKTKKIISLFYK